MDLRRKARIFDEARRLCVRRKEFESVLTGCYAAYLQMCKKGVLVKNDENEIRNRLLDDYLKDDLFKSNTSNLASFHFDKEICEGEKGRADIRVLHVCPYVGDKAYYLIECKRLDGCNPKGDNGLNGKYIKNGICRFVKEKYATHLGVNGMLGFIVSDLDADKNVMALNWLLAKRMTDDDGDIVVANATQKMSSIMISGCANRCYQSKHITYSGNEIILYHLMLDVSSLIEGCVKQ